MSILIVNAAEWGPEHASPDYPKDVADWIADGFGGDPSRFDVWRPQREEAAPQPVPEAVVIGGSACSTYDDHAWIGRLAERIRNWADRGTPMLGICFGHQMIAHALGGSVEKSPNGWEIGTCEVGLTRAGAADPLLAHLPSTLTVLQSHQDIVTQMPPGATCLAANDHTACEAMRIGDSIHSVQFHPEYTVGHIGFLLGPRRKMLEAASVDYDAVIEGLVETPESRSILARFQSIHSLD